MWFRAGSVLLVILSTSATATAAPIWTQLIPIGSGPPTGVGSQSVGYDAVADRLIVFGGASNDSWVLVNATGEAGTPTWVQLNPVAQAGLPPARSAHSVIYDQLTNRMVVFGGAGSTLLNDVWVLKDANGIGTPEWLQLFPSGGPPQPREGHGAFYNAATDEMFIFGGGNNGAMIVPNDLWVLTHATQDTGWQWTQLASDSPPRVEHFALAYNPTSNIATIAAGCCGYTNAVRILANPGGGNQNWGPVSPGGAPPPVGDAISYGYDSFSDRLIVQGIAPGGNGNATWVLTDATNPGGSPTWIGLIPEGAAGSPPEQSVRVGSAYNSSLQKLVLALNDTTNGSPIPEVWVLSEADGLPQRTSTPTSTPTETPTPTSLPCQFSSAPGEERCFGGIGPQCDGVPYSPISIYFTPNDQMCTVSGWASGGSILHDGCCHWLLNSFGEIGYCCGDLTACLLDETGVLGSKTCKAEWRLARSDVACARMWQQDFGPYLLGGTGDDTRFPLRAPTGARIDHKHCYLCKSGACTTNAKGRTIVFIQKGTGCSYSICS